MDDCLVKVTVVEARPPPDEYETDSEDAYFDREDEYTALTHVPISGWICKVRLQ